MKFFLEDKTTSKQFNLNKNIFLIYGENNAGKTSFLNELETKIKNNKVIFEDIEYENFNEVIFIEEDFDLKKEIELKSSSKLKKVINSKLNKIIENNQYDLLEQIINNSKFNDILKDLDKSMNFQNIKNYKIESTISFRTNYDLISSLISLKLYKNNEIINELNLSKSEKFKIFYSLFASNLLKNKIILFDCPENIFSENSFLDFNKYLEDISKNNLIFITYRNANLFSIVKNLYQNKFYYLNNYQIDSFHFNKNFLIKTYMYKNNQNIDYKNIDSEIKKLSPTLLEEDYFDLYEIVYNWIWPKIIKVLDTNKNCLNLNKNKKFFSKLEIDLIEEFGFINSLKIN